MRILKKQKIVLLGTFLFFIAFASLGNAAFSGITVGKKWTLKLATNPTSYISFDVTSVTAVTVMANTYADGETAGNINIGGTYVYSDAMITSFVGMFGTDTATYGGQSLTVCDTGTIVFDTVSGIWLEATGVFSFHSWSLYSSGDDAIPGYSLVLVLLAVIGTSAYILKKRYNKR